MQENPKKFDDLKYSSQEDLVGHAMALCKANVRLSEYEPIAAAIISVALSELHGNTSQQDINDALKSIEFLNQDTDNSKIIDAFAGKIKNRMTNGQTPQQAFEDIIKYEPNWFWRFINWCAKIFINTEKSLKDNISFMSRSGLHRIAQQKETERIAKERQEQERIAKERQELRLEKQRIAKERQELRLEKQRIASIKIQSFYRGYIIRKKMPLPKDLFRRYLVRDKCDFKQIVAAQRINSSMHEVSKMSNQDGEWYVKGSGSREVSAAAMMQFYLGSDKTTKYVLIKNNNQKNLVASLSVPVTTMTLNQYINHKKEADWDEKKFLFFKEKFAEDYISPTLQERAKYLGLTCHYNEFIKCKIKGLISLPEIKDIVNHQWQIKKLISLPEIKDIVNHQDNLEFIKEIYCNIQHLDKYKEFFIDKIIRNIEKNSTYRTNKSIAIWLETSIAMNIKNLATKDDPLTEQNKQDIKKYCNENWNFVSVNVNSKDYNMDGSSTIDALGGFDSPLLKDYIRLQLANFKVKNYDGHNNNIIVTLNEHGKATGLVPIDFGCGSSYSGKDNFDNVKECLDFCKPGMVKKIAEEFEAECSQTQKLYDLAKLLGAKEEEYRHLQDKDLTAADFKEYVEKALDRKSHVATNFMTWLSS
jgi:hypothetical protein